MELATTTGFENFMTIFQFYNLKLTNVIFRLTFIGSVALKQWNKYLGFYFVYKNVSDTIFYIYNECIACLFTLIKSYVIITFLFFKMPLFECWRSV